MPCLRWPSAPPDDLFAAGPALIVIITDVNLILPSTFVYIHEKIIRTLLVFNNNNNNNNNNNFNNLVPDSCFELWCWCFVPFRSYIMCIHVYLHEKIMRVFIEKIMRMGLMFSACRSSSPSGTARRAATSPRP